MINLAPENAAQHVSKMEMPPRKAGEGVLRVGESSLYPSILTASLA